MVWALAATVFLGMCFLGMCFLIKCLLGSNANINGSHIELSPLSFLLLPNHSTRVS